jgi:hypothetical protein
MSIWKSVGLIIQRHDNKQSHVNWKVFFTKSDCDIQRPCPGAGYPGVASDNKYHTLLESGFACELPNTLPDAGTSPICPDRSANPLRHADSDVAPAENLVMQPDALAIDAAVSDLEDEPADLDSLAKKHAHSVYIDGKWIHIATAVCLLFNTLPRPKQSKERLQRVRDYTPPSVAAHLRALVGDSFMVGHCVATLLRCESSAHLAIIQVTHLVRAGQDVYTISPTEISSTETRVELRGQVLAFKPQGLKEQDHLSWKGPIARLRPLKKASKAKDILVVSFPGMLAIPIAIPEVTSNEEALHSWDISMADLSVLASRLWSQISPKYTAKLASCSISEGFPYQASTGATSCCFISETTLTLLNQGKIV